MQNNNNNSSNNTNGHSSTESNSTDQDGVLDVSAYHKLDCSWTIWVVDPSRKITGLASSQNATTTQDDYMSSLENMGTFDTVEDFWIIFHKLKPPSKMAPNETYHLFKTGIKPTWEDPVNHNGGKWVLNFMGNNRFYVDVDTVWENIVLGIVGETIDTERDICGLVLNKRDNLERISIWNRDSTNSKCIESLRTNILEKANQTAKINIKYQTHGTMSNSQSSVPTSNPAASS